MAAAEPFAEVLVVVELVVVELVVVGLAVI
jgi:hypothetical protein